MIRLPIWADTLGQTRWKLIRVDAQTVGVCLGAMDFRASGSVASEPGPEARAAERGKMCTQKHCTHSIPDYAGVNSRRILRIRSV